MMRAWIFLIFLLSACAAQVPANSDCETISHAAQNFTVCRFETSEDIRLHLTHPDGAPYAQFDRLSADIEAQGKTLVFAMNAGMYHDDLSPVGLYVEDSNQAMRLVTNAGPGNFGMLPNGVLSIGSDGQPDVTESLAFEANNTAHESATQSGPMLVIDGMLHPRFNPDGTSRKRRNGVGITENGDEIIFAISDGFVTFYEFGTLFRDVLATPNALYLDGTISRLYAPSIGRNDPGVDLGPMVSIIRD